jgi:hypothetical protein
LNRFHLNKNNQARIKCASGSPDHRSNTQSLVRPQGTFCAQFAPLRHFPVTDGKKSNPGDFRAGIRAYCIVFSRIRYFFGPGKKGPGKSQLYGPRSPIRALYEGSIPTPRYPFPRFLLRRRLPAKVPKPGSPSYFPQSHNVKLSITSLSMK